MLFELIAAVVAGVALAGIAMSVRWISRGRLPKWIVPAAAGLGMISYAIWSEYSWFDRMRNSFPQSVVVTWSNTERAIWRPWSYIRPLTTRFTAVETSTAKRHPQQPGQVMVSMILAARWQQTTVIKAVFDCDNNRRADLVGNDVSIADDGSVTGAQWIDLPADDANLKAACRQP
ncbi:hypothetical protein [Pseudorhizobium flavum]|jgi:hypothetical protein|uniref:hypothetical protein n=1 Tax=Pseudorhizobium flavum TaxID=1335061 RepID=UPI0012665921|nr:hypothetical protein [Pseudorhizobium flavum]CAD6595990.1 hypothetical protein RKHAN_00185 [Rhizobium sp. Khangiran2]